VSPEVLRASQHGMHDDRAVARGDDADLEEIARMIRADEHGQVFVEVFGADRIVERVQDRVVAHAVFASSRGNDRLLHVLQVTLPRAGTQGNLFSAPRL